MPLVKPKLTMEVQMLLQPLLMVLLARSLRTSVAGNSLPQDLPRRANSLNSSSSSSSSNSNNNKPVLHITVSNGASLSI
jgi:hypothetical protein